MTLYVVPTPVGNLEDITLRALRVLREADTIACEDTRRTGQLLGHYEIENSGRLLAYHEHNEESLAPRLTERAKTGEIALVSDAGTPLVSDPGYRLVRACAAAGARVEVLPGPSAVTLALVASTLPPEPFAFLGFPPRKGRERRELFERIQRERMTFVLFESPKRLVKTLREMPPEIPLAVCRELTKLHEEVFRGTASEAIEHFAGEVRGEVVVVARGGSGGSGDSGTTLEDAVDLARGYAGAGAGPSQAAARAARETGHRRQEVYARLVET